jgi:hypothetical protein
MEPLEILDFDAAMQRTVNTNPRTRHQDDPRNPEKSFFKSTWLRMTDGAGFQWFILIIFLVVLSSYTPILLGLTFLEKEPERFECYHDDTEQWTECTKTEICEEHLDHDHYHAIEDDPEYIDNWV